MWNSLTWVIVGICFVRLKHRSELDDVVVDFVAGMICGDESDIDQLTEMLNAYIPQFGEIEA